MPATSPRDARALAAFELALVHVCLVRGLAFEAVRDKRNRRFAAAHARQLAAYLAVTQFNVPRKALARALGLAPINVRRPCMAIEERRDVPAFDREIEAIEERIAA